MEMPIRDGRRDPLRPSSPRSLQIYVSKISPPITSQNDLKLFISKENTFKR